MRAAHINHPDDPFVMLEVPRNATKEQLEEAYKAKYIEPHDKSSEEEIKEQQKIKHSKEVIEAILTRRAKLKEHFDVLEIPLNATKEESNAAFRAKSLANHPDRGGSNEVYQKVVAAHDEIKKILERRAKLKVLLANPSLATQWVPSDEEIEIEDSVQLEEWLFQCLLGSKLYPAGLAVVFPDANSRSILLGNVLNTPQDELPKLFAISSCIFPLPIYFFHFYVPSYICPIVQGMVLVTSASMTYQQCGLVYSNLGVIAECIVGLKLNPYDMSRVAIHTSTALCNTTILAISTAALVGCLIISADLLRYHGDTIRNIPSTISEYASSVYHRMRPHADNLNAERAQSAAEPAMAMGMVD